MVKYFTFFADGVATTKEDVLRVLKWSAIALTFSCLSSQAFAQRGADYTGTGKPWDSNTQGFPGFFDTNMAAPGSIVTETPALFWIIPTPSLSVDYGVNESLTVGTNALVTGLPWIFGGNGISLKVRSLIYGSDTNQSTATLYTGYIHFRNNSDPVYSNYQVATWNHAWRPSARHTFSTQVMYFRLALDSGSSSSINHAKVAATLGTLGGGYGLRLTERWGMGLNAFFSAYTGFEIDSAGASMDQQSKALSSDSTILFLRFLTDCRLSENWLLSFGIVGIGTSGSGLTPGPWISAAKRW